MPSPLKNQPPLNIARFTGFFIECVLTGVYWVHFFLYVESVRKRSKSSGQNLFKTPMFAVGATIFIIATGHFIVLVISSFLAFVNCVTTDAPFDQRGYLSLSSHWVIAYSSMYIPIPVVADAFLIYRLFIVWGRNVVITIPAVCLCIALLVTEAVAANLFRTSFNTIFDKSRRWLVSAFALTFACNIYCTFLIALRIALAQRSVRDTKLNPKTTKLQKYLEILIQSAALYCFLALLSLIFSVVESTAVYITIGATSPTIVSAFRYGNSVRSDRLIQGICFCMIVTRPYNVDVGQTIGTVTSVHPSWRASGVPLAEQGSEGFRALEDPERTLAGNETKGEERHLERPVTQPCIPAQDDVFTTDSLDCVTTMQGKHLSI
ncbi:hypothetical protein JR316_0009924 [Psilocybe cubensis]|uniref:Uncharacterized protein n=2 Tax=Psilocybe cubensis TaxID=181762 RepID=A0A8H7XMX6_PSICU|nr:hypothetical protein JR316_0009924 [Psilocybe cubensis]KAH9477698.1 hypothetical protein JR316_0009924 [Psilocybe cubensis]